MAYEAARRRGQRIGRGGVGTDGQVLAAEVLAELNASSRSERLRGRALAWRVLAPSASG